MGLFAVSDPAQKCQKYGSFNLHPITRRYMSHAVCGYYYLYYINYNNIVYYFGKQSMLQQHPALCVVQSSVWKNALRNYILYMQ